jgi:hypothetical protein
MPAQTLREDLRDGGTRFGPFDTESTMVRCLRPYRVPQFMRRLPVVGMDIHSSCTI